MSTGLKEALGNIDLENVSLDDISVAGPQLLKALKEVKARNGTIVAHQNHGSHGDTHKQEKALLKRPASS